MKKLFTLSIIILSVIAESTAQNYIQNRAPLADVPFYALPVGAVRAQGWLLTQLELQKNGLTGYSETLYNGNGDLGAGCDWLGGAGDSWERAPYYVKGLVALAYVLDDAELKTKAQKWIDWSLNNQNRYGFFGPARNTDWWARMPMLYAIRDYYEATGDTRVIPFFTNYFQYQNKYIDSQPLSSWGKSRAGDNIEIVLWLYNRTGDAFLLALADKLKAQAYDWTDIYTNNKFNYFGTDFQPKHNVNIPQAQKMPAIYWQKSQSAADRNAYFAGREHLLHDHGQPCGMQSGSEMLAGKSSLTGLESCSVVEQMQTNETAQMILGDASIGDQLEKLAFNALPAIFSTDMKALSYYQQANQVTSKLGYYGFAQHYDNGNMRSPSSGYGCCRFDVNMGYPYFVKTMWAATADGGLAVMAYAPSSVTAYVADSVQVSFAENTAYPFSETINLTLTTAQTVTFPLKLRIPAWCNSPEIKVNGTLQNGVESGSFYTINRAWNNDDVVAIRFPMQIKINEEVNNSVSVQYGALVFSLKINENIVVRQDFGGGFKEVETLPASAWNYALVLDRNNPANSLSVTVNPAALAENNFYQNTPLTLSASARKVNLWTLAHNERIATDPPFSPVTTTAAVEQITLVPYGSQTLRLTCIPTVGANNLITNIFTENFENGQSGWVQYGGSWRVENGEYRAGDWTAGHPCSKSVFAATDFSDFTYNAKVKVGANGDAGLMFRASRLSFAPDDYNGYYVGISSERNTVELGKANGAWNSLIAVNTNISANEWHDLRVVTEGNRIKIYVDDMNTPKINITDASFSTGCIGIRAYNALASWDGISVVARGYSGVNQSKADNNLQLYPNPTNDKLIIENGKLTIKEVQILDLTGKIILNSQPSIFNSIDVSFLQAGLYFVQLTTDNGTFCAQFLKRAG